MKFAAIALIAFVAVQLCHAAPAPEDAKEASVTPLVDATLVSETPASVAPAAAKAETSAPASSPAPPSAEKKS